jgi:hypothetical protein
VYTTALEAHAHAYCGIAGCPLYGVLPLRAKHTGVQKECPVSFASGPAIVLQCLRDAIAAGQGVIGTVVVCVRAHMRLRLSRATPRVTNDCCQFEAFMHARVSTGLHKLCGYSWRASQSPAACPRTHVQSGVYAQAACVPARTRACISPQIFAADRCLTVVRPVDASRCGAHQ